MAARRRFESVENYSRGWKIRAHYEWVESKGQKDILICCPSKGRFYTDGGYNLGPTLWTVKKRVFSVECFDAKTKRVGTDGAENEWEEEPGEWDNEWRYVSY